MKNEIKKRVLKFLTCHCCCLNISVVKEQTGLNKIVGQLGTNIYTKFYSIKKYIKNREQNLA